MNKVNRHGIAGIANHGLDNGRELFKPYQPVSNYSSRASPMCLLLLVDRCFRCVPAILIDPEISDAGEVFSTRSVTGGTHKQGSSCVCDALPSVLDEIPINMDFKRLRRLVKGGVNIWYRKRIRSRGEDKAAAKG